MLFIIKKKERLEVKWNISKMLSSDFYLNSPSKWVHWEALAQDKSYLRHRIRDSVLVAEHSRHLIAQQKLYRRKDSTKAHYLTDLSHQCGECRKNFYSHIGCISDIHTHHPHHLSSSCVLVAVSFIDKQRIVNKGPIIHPRCTGCICLIDQSPLMGDVIIACWWLCSQDFSWYQI